MAGQVRGSLGAGIGTVRTESGSSFSSASLAPELRYAAPSLVVSASTFFASLPAGVWASHGRLYAWGSTPRIAGRWRLAAEGNLAGTSWTGGAWTAAVHGLGEVLWSAPQWGFGLGAGPSAGWIANDSSVVALHTRARAWWRPGGRASGTEWQVIVEPTHFVGAWFTDVSAVATVERGPAVLSISPEARVSPVYGSYSAGSAFLQLAVAPSVSVEVGGGSYLRDPYQGFPRGGFFTLGVRIGSTRAGRAAAARKLAPLVLTRRGDSVVVRFRFSGVRMVAIAGDWNAWQPYLLRAVGGEVWEGTLSLKPGLYHFNLQVDGRDWVVPKGVATVPDGLGGMVAVLVLQ
ncbi:MAG TPA: glycogen-binding domain-containing protein [Gemmatimonadales bacterium]|nr:glycogen-binding domain-containing protein [Gemmatimonadales bacterium]